MTYISPKERLQNFSRRFLSFISVADEAQPFGMNRFRFTGDFGIEYYIDLTDQGNFKISVAGGLTQANFTTTGEPRAMAAAVVSFRRIQKQAKEALDLIAQIDAESKKQEEVNAVQRQALIGIGATMDHDDDAIKNTGSLQEHLKLKVSASRIQCAFALDDATDSITQDKLKRIAAILAE